MDFGRVSELTHGLTICSAVNENAQGGLQSFLIGQQGVLSGPLDTISSGGDSPAFATALSTGQVAVMNVCFHYSLFEMS